MLSQATELLRSKWRPTLSPDELEVHDKGGFFFVGVLPARIFSSSL
jgi:hypothetical protein